MRRVLVTGAAGFIGFHAALRLHERGDFVVGLDNFNTYYTPTLKRARAEILKQKGVEVLEGDICDQTALIALCQKNEFTDILHLAAQAGVRYARVNPQAYIKSNIDGFLQILETCRASPHVKLTFASSSSVYGTNEKIPFEVNDRTDHPANLYAATKKANELMAYSYHHLYNIKMTALRYFTVYGPYGRPDMAIYLFTESILKGEPLHLFNQGEMSRDFTYIDDAIQGTLAAVDYEAPFDIFNIGNNHPEKLMTLVAMLEKLLNKKAILRFEERSAGEVETTFADIEYTKRKLKFNPQTKLEEGLEKFVEWYQSFKHL